MDTRTSKIPNLLAEIRSRVLAGQIEYTTHANLRLYERDLTKPEVEYVLLNGYHEIRRDRYNVFFDKWDYSVRGLSGDMKAIRIILSFDDSNILIITAVEIKKGLRA